MAQWVWEAQAKSGEARNGIMEAESEAAVQSKLKQQNLTPTKIKKKFRIPLPWGGGSGVSQVELVIFIRQFATMIDAGLPLVQCLDILSAQGENQKFNAILKGVKADVEVGSSFSDALRKYPALFDQLFVNLIQAGEVGGILDTILARLSIYIEKNVKLKRQVKSALVYPMGIMGVAVIVISVLMIFVIPSFEKMFADFGGADGLPGITKFVISVSQNFVAASPFLVVGGMGGSWLLKWTYAQPRGQLFFDRLLITMPIMGPVMRKIAVARFTRTLGTLLGAGVPILDAMSIVAKTSGNKVVENAIDATSEQISQGKSMAEPLLATRVFPPMVVQMIGVGEQTGAIDTMLNKIADFYEEEVDVAVAGLTSLLEPLMMVFIGGIVGFILVAMYMPIFDIAGKIKS